MSKDGYKLLTAFAGMLALIALLVSMLGPQASAQSGDHNAGHAEHHDEYMQWKPPGSARPCCSARVEKDDGTVTGDCRPVRARQDLNGNWQAFVDGKWLDIPKETILPIKAKDGRSHYCGVEGMTFCFVPAEVRS